MSQRTTLCAHAQHAHRAHNGRREAALEEFKHGPGAAKARLLVENRARVRELKARAKVSMRLA